MILVGNQRGGAKDLALHLMKEENEHVEVHELSGFMSDNLMGALNEIYAISQGTQCKQFMYSLSLNPPPQAETTTEDFENAINRAQDRLELDDYEEAKAKIDEAIKITGDYVASQKRASAYRIFRSAHTKTAMRSMYPAQMELPLDREEAA